MIYLAGAVMFLGSAVQADTVTTYSSNSQPATVLDSYMKPTVVRERQVTDSNGVTERVVEPLVQERHEVVAIPIEEKVTTTSVRPGQTIITTTPVATTTVKRRSTATKRVAVRKKKVRKVVSSNSVKQQSYVAQKAYTEPASIVESTQLQRREVIMERKHPSLLY